MPSVLVETGFITNKKEGDYLNSVEGKNNISKSISDAILDYKLSLNTDVLVENSKSETETAQAVVFKVQIAAGSKKIVIKPNNFKGLDKISRVKSNAIYRYFYGSTSSFDTAVDLQKKAIAKGYSDAFVVAYKNDQKISIQTALKTTK